MQADKSPIKQLQLPFNHHSNHLSIGESNYICTIPRADQEVTFQQLVLKPTWGSISFVGKSDIINANHLLQHGKFLYSIAKNINLHSVHKSKIVTLSNFHWVSAKHGHLILTLLVPCAYICATSVCPSGYELQQVLRV